MVAHINGTSIELTNVASIKINMSKTPILRCTFDINRWFEDDEKTKDVFFDAFNDETPFNLEIHTLEGNEKNIMMMDKCRIHRWRSVVGSTHISGEQITGEAEYYYIDIINVIERQVEIFMDKLERLNTMILKGAFDEARKTLHYLDSIKGSVRKSPRFREIEESLILFYDQIYRNV